MTTKDRIYIYIGIALGTMAVTIFLSLHKYGLSLLGLLPIGASIMVLGAAGLTAGVFHMSHSAAYAELKELNQRQETLHEHRIAELMSIIDIQSKKLKDADERIEEEERRAKIAEQGNKGSLLLTIAAMRELLAEPSRGRNQSGIISEIQTRYPKRRGLSKRSLEDNFSAANTAAELATKDGD